MRASFAGVFFNDKKPLQDVVIGTLIGDVKSNDETLGTVIVAGGDGLGTKKLDFSTKQLKHSSYCYQLTEAQKKFGGVVLTITE